ncbi:hypothetical protein ACFZC7_29020 [Streptomyces massasporeus]
MVSSASTINSEDGPCTSELRGEKVPVKLVPYGEWPVTAQSRS